MDHEPYFTPDIRQGAAHALLCLMTGISEEHWCAGWMTGLEYNLWGAAEGDQIGKSRITARQATLLKLLAEEADGWWLWHNDEPTFFDSHAWRAHLATLDPEPDR